METINRAVDAVVDSIRPIDGRFGWGDGMWNDITDVIPSLDELFDIVDNDAFENITLESAREGARKFSRCKRRDLITNGARPHPISGLGRAPSRREGGAVGCRLRASS